MVVSVKPAEASRRRNSASVRSKAPSITNIVKSMKAVPRMATDSVMRAGMTRSTSKQSTLGLHGLATVPQNGSGPVIRPVMNHNRQNIGVACRRHALKEVASNTFATGGETPRRDERSCSFDRSRKVEENAVELRVGFKNRSQQAPLAAANVDNLLEARKIIHARHARGPQRREPSHRGIKVGARGRMRSAVREIALTIDGFLPTKVRELS